MKNRLYLALSIFLAMAICLFVFIGSLPRVISQESIAVELISDYPDLERAYNQLFESNSDMIVGESISIVTVKSIWGSCNYYLLPCYAAVMNNVPEHGNASWSTALYMLSCCSDENSMISKLCKLHIQNVNVNVMVDDHTLIATRAEITPVDTVYDTRGERAIKLKERFSVSGSPTIHISLLASTSGNAEKVNEQARGAYIWNYSVFINKQPIQVYRDIRLEHAYIINAQ